jgi:hypothetical protein
MPGCSVDSPADRAPLHAVPDRAPQDHTLAGLYVDGKQVCEHLQTFVEFQR